MSIQRRCDICDSIIKGKFWNFREISLDGEKEMDVCTSCFKRLTYKHKKETDGKDGKN